MSTAMALLSGPGYTDFVVVLDEHHRPVGLVDRDSALTGAASQPMKVNLATTTPAAARRMLTRPANSRFAPVVCHDDSGHYAGIVRAERILADLAARTEAGVN